MARESRTPGADHRNLNVNSDPPGMQKIVYALEYTCEFISTQERH